MTQVKKAFFWSFAEKYSNLVLQIVSTLILARLLTPAEIGIASVGLGLVSIMHSLRDFGVNNYIVQEKELTQKKLATAFGIAIIVSAVAFISLITLSFLAPWIYEDSGDSVQLVVFISSITFLFLPLSAYKMAVYTRDMDFFKIGRVNVISGVVQNGSVIVLAFMGWSYLSIPIAAVLGTLSLALGVLYFSPAGDRIIRPTLSEWRHVLPFTGFMSFASIIKDIGVVLPEMVIAKFLGFSATGFFSRAKGLVGLFNQFIMKAAQPVLLSMFAEEHRAGKDLGESFVRVSSFVTGAACAFFVFLSVNAEAVIYIMFGDQWLLAAPLLTVFALGASLTITNIVSLTCLVAMGQAKKYMNYALFVECFKVAGVIIAAQYDLITCVIFLASVGIVEFILYFNLVRKLANINIAGFLYHAIVKGWVIAALSIMPSLIATYYLNINLLDFLNMVAVGIATLVFWVAALFVVNHPIKVTMLDLIKTRLLKRA